MASIATIRAAIQSAIGDIPLRCYDFFPTNLNPPCAIVGFPTEYLPNDTFGDTARMVVPVSIYVGYGSNRAAEDALEAFLATSGSGSVIAAIEDISTGYSVRSVRDFGLVENTNGQPVALGCIIDVDVLA
jgi:hypothetical protein